MGYDGSLKFDTGIDESGFNSGIQKLGSIAKGGMAVVGSAVAGGVAAFGALTKASLDSVASLEQNVGGVETLFKDSADVVIENANRAYETAGMSANDYMSTVTSFSASLLQSVSGDTKKAADVADMAITDMSDNANKMGTSMELIQNAYQGFAKQNYTMLDNLKLGYGGTKTEMERLLADAEKISGVKYDINNLNDVYSAIHVVQEELGITGTTAKEAASTIEGSMSSAKASWDNFLNGSSSAEEFADAFGTAAENIIRNLGEIIPRLAETIPSAVNSIIEHIATALGENGDKLIQSGVGLLQSILNGIIQALPLIVGCAMQIIQPLLSGIIELLPLILDAGMQILIELANGIAQALPELIPQAVNCILSLVDTLLNNIDQLIDCGINLLLGLAEGIGQALPEIMLQMPYIIMKLVAALVNNLPKIVSAGIEIIGALLTGIIKAFPNIINQIPQMFSKMKKCFTETDWKSIGKCIIDGIVSGIKKFASSIAESAKNAAKDALNAVKKLLGIHSPSTVFRDQIGKNMALGMGGGFEDNIPVDDMTGSVSKSIQKMKRKISGITQITPANAASSIAESHLSNTQTNEDSLEDATLHITNVFEVDGTKLIEKTTTATIKKINSNQKDRDKAKGKW